MKLMIDDARIEKIKEIWEIYPVEGVTTNPTILAKSGRNPYEVLKEIRGYTDIPIIAGGLISDKKDIMAAFAAGADAISTTKEDLWFA